MVNPVTSVSQRVTVVTLAKPLDARRWRPQDGVDPQWYPQAALWLSAAQRQRDVGSCEALVADKTACTVMPIRESHSFVLLVHTTTTRRDTEPRVALWCHCDHLWPELNVSCCCRPLASSLPAARSRTRRYGCAVNPPPKIRAASALAALPGLKLSVDFLHQGASSPVGHPRGLDAVFA